MTGPRITTGGALWVEPEDRGLGGRLVTGLYVDDPTQAGDLALATTGVVRAELRVFADGDTRLVRTDGIRAFVPDPAHPGDYIFGDVTAAGARYIIPDPVHVGDVTIGVSPRVLDHATTTDGDMLLLSPTAPRRLVLRRDGDYVLQ